MAKLLSSLENYVQRNVRGFDEIPDERTMLLQQLARFVEERVAKEQPAQLVFICTHNSRRSHLSQIWAQTAAHYFGIPGVVTYSGGTEATAFNPRAVAAIERAGFSVEKTGDDVNPTYLVRYAADVPPLRCFSKTFDHPENPRQDFCAVMTCSDADEACPTIFGAAARIPLRYEDPKAFDGTPQEAEKYDERCLQIAREMFWAMSRVRHKNS